MKKLVPFMFLIPTLTLVLLGCANQGPDPEQSSREAQQRHEADQQQAEFRKDLPPVSNPSQVR
jgi:PBP1b-binding outer membrane lipoprotein LpoB